MERPNVQKGIDRQKEPELVTPYHKATLDAFAKEMPEKREQMELVLAEIDRQAIGNFGVYESESQPGVAFSYSTLSITPEIIIRLHEMGPQVEVTPGDAPEESIKGKERDIDAEQQDYFLFTGFAFPPDGNAFTVQDVTIDRFIRLLPRVANAMRTGVTPPKITVHMLGAPTGMAGTVTAEWIANVRKKGFDAYGTLYAEYVQKSLPEISGKRHVVLQGVSKGALVAQKTAAALPEKLQKVTQRLLDNPAGEHTPGSSWANGARILKGFAQEAVSQKRNNELMKSLVKLGGPFIKEFMDKKGLKKDSTTQSARKWNATYYELRALLKGASLDNETIGSYIRRATEDPLTFSAQRRATMKEKQDAGNPLPFVRTGKSLEVPFKGTHMLFYNRYKRWAQILDFVNKTNA